MKYYATDGVISQSTIEGSIEISAEQYQEALAGMAQGHVVTICDGFAVGPKPEPEPEPEPVPPTIEQLADTTRAERDRLIESVRWRIERHSDELALGREPTEQLEPLLQYVQALRDVPQQAGFPTDIVWPETPMDATR